MSLPLVCVRATGELGTIVGTDKNNTWIYFDKPITPQLRLHLGMGTRSGGERIFSRDDPDTVGQSSDNIGIVRNNLITILFF